MPNYQNGKIYTIRCRSDDNLIYVGSTTQKLSQRLTNHRNDCKRSGSISLYNYITNDDWSDWYIELYELYPCNSKEDLEKREGQVIREIGNINKCIAGRTRKEYRQDNEDKIKEKTKEWRENNKEKIKEYDKEWRENNKEERKGYIKEKNKEYRKNNVEKIKEYKCEKICCDICGALSNLGHLARHKKSKKCLSKIVSS